MLDLNTYLKSGETTISNLVLTHYQELNMTDQELIFYLQLLKFQQKNRLFPDLGMIAKTMNKDQDTIYRLLQNLINHDIIKIITTKNNQGQTVDAYDTSGIYIKLEQLLKMKHKQTDQIQNENKTQELYQLFEKEFGRPLSPIELESIKLWLTQDNYSIDLIRLALREAVLNQAYSLKYMDRILLSWERKNMTTKEQVLAEQAARKKRLDKNDRDNTSYNQDKLPKVPLYNWVEPKK